MSNKQKYAVVVPIYQESRSQFEEIALEQCFKVFTDCEVIAIKPTKIVADSRFSKSISFENSYFESVFGYNRLMLSTNFYSQFTAYDYILIYQLDAFAFSNQLELWCNKGYDYIGAPWLNNHDGYSAFKLFKEEIRSYIHRRYNLKGKSGKPALDKQLNKQVGNGGFSLRKVDKFIAICKKYKDLISEYELVESGFFNEDIFFSIELNRKENIVKIPGYKEALHFAIETEPQKAIELTGNQLPFGCHGWIKNIAFWKPYFAEMGYTI